MWRHSDIKPCKQSHLLVSPPPSLCALPCPLTYTKPSAYRGTPQMIKVRPTLASGLSLPQCSPPIAVRKAYKKRALQTHPDRVPPEQKATAGDEFRKVRPIRPSTLRRRSFWTYSRSTTHTKCLTILVSVRYVVAYLGVPWSQHSLVSDFVHRF